MKKAATFGDNRKIDPEATRRERVVRIGQRANELMKIGFYSKEEVLELKQMVENNICIVQIEWLLLDAEEMARRAPARSTV